MHLFSFKHAKEEFVVTAGKLSALLVNTKQEFDKYRRANAISNQPAVWFDELPSPLEYLTTHEQVFKSIFHSGPPVPQPEAFRQRYITVEISYRCRATGTSGMKNSSSSDSQMSQQLVVQQSQLMWQMMQGMQGMLQNGQNGSGQINIIGQPRGPRRSNTSCLGDDIGSAETRRPLMLTFGDSHQGDVSPASSERSPVPPRMALPPPMPSEDALVACPVVPRPISAVLQPVAPAVAPTQAVERAGAGEAPSAENLLDAILERNKANQELAKEKAKAAKAKATAKAKAEASASAAAATWAAGLAVENAAAMAKASAEAAALPPQPKANAKAKAAGAAPAALLPPPKAKAKATAKAKAEASASAADATWAAGLAVENAAAMAKASAEAAALPPQPKANAKASVDAPAFAAGPPPALGCAKCRGSPNGCAQCKNPLFKGKRSRRT
jgi:hypothetical protein